MKLTKQIGIVLLWVSLVSVTKGQGVLNGVPRASFTQRVGVTDIRMEYSRLNATNTGGWHGISINDKPWNPSGDEPTFIEFSTDVFVGENELSSGKYLLSLFYNKNTVVFVFERYYENIEEDVEGRDRLEVKSAVEETCMKNNLMFYADDLSDSHCVLYIDWYGLRAGFTIDISTEDYILDVYKKKLKEADENCRIYSEAAEYFLKENKGNQLRFALSLAQKSVAISRDYKALTILAEAYAANGELKKARKTAEEAKDLSKKAGSDEYYLRNQTNIDDW